MYKYQQNIVFIKTHYIEYLQYSHTRMANFHFQGITVFGGTDHVSHAKNSIIHSQSLNSRLEMAM